jgi:hypothetical protein
MIVSKMMREAGIESRNISPYIFFIVSWHRSYSDPKLAHLIRQSIMRFHGSRIFREIGLLYDGLFDVQTEFGSPRLKAPPMNISPQ